MARAVVILIFWLISLQGTAQYFFVKKDLGPEWLMYSEGVLTPYDAGNNPRAVYIRIDPSRYKGDYLAIQGIHVFSVFVNGQFVWGNTNDVTISIDSLAVRISRDEFILVGLYKSNGIRDDLTTSILTDISQPAGVDSGPLEKPHGGFKNFVITAFLVLIILFVFMLRLNPKLTFSYFSLTKLFFLRESDDVQMVTRIAGSGNVLFYFFASLMAGYIFMLLSNGTTLLYTLNLGLQSEEFWEAALLWLQVSAFVLIFFLVKAILISSVAILYGIRDFSGFHLFNFLRALLMAMVIIAILVSVYYVALETKSIGYLFFYKSIGWILTGWSVLVFLKLMRRVHFSVFHLFSYICVTEIIPNLIILKFLYE